MTNSVSTFFLWNSLSPVLLPEFYNLFAIKRQVYYQLQSGKLYSSFCARKKKYLQRETRCNLSDFVGTMNGLHCSFDIYNHLNTFNLRFSALFLIQFYILYDNVILQ